MRPLLSLLVVAMPCFGRSQVETAIAPGDRLLVTTAGFQQYSGEFLVMLDGKVTLGPYGSFKASGKTAKQLEGEVILVARKYIRDPLVTIGVSEQKARVVYVLSSRGTDSGFEWTPGMGVRAALNRASLGPLDDYSARLFRDGALVATLDLRELFRATPEVPDIPMAPGDILWLADAASVFTMVEGNVQRPGPIRVRPGDSVSDAISRAGGVNESSLVAFTPEEVVVNIQRGHKTISHSLRAVMQGAGGSVEEGDRIVVERPAQVRATLGGRVAVPGTRAFRAGTSIAEAIEQSGGPGPEGTLREVLVFRGSTVLRFDLYALAKGGQKGPALEDGDFVSVPVNERAVYVFGFVERPGKKHLADTLEPRLADALDLGGGLQPRGTLRRAVVLRSNEKGEFKETIYNLDVFLKDGDLSQNPALMPGDVVFFDQTRGTSLADILRVLPGLLLAERVFD
ncbi:MAG: SLBB domain-containing protein [Fimbriimonadaceae bacterium]|nr:SLBB domain-containing protein [Fimbriimonadaceae bacterium]